MWLGKGVILTDVENGDFFPAHKVVLLAQLY